MKSSLSSSSAALIYGTIKLKIVGEDKGNRFFLSLYTIYVPIQVIIKSTWILWTWTNNANADENMPMTDRFRFCYANSDYIMR